MHIGMLVDGADNVCYMKAYVAASGSRRVCLQGLMAGSLLAVLYGCSAPRVQPPSRSPTPAPLEPDASQRLPDEQPAPSAAQAVAIHAMGLVGTPYRYGGNTPESGFDCSGLIAYVHWHAARIRTPRSVAELSGWGAPVPHGAARTGDLAVFTVKGRTNHAGIFVGNGRFVHAPSTGGTVKLDRLDSGYWARQGLGFRRAVS